MDAIIDQYEEGEDHAMKRFTALLIVFALMACLAGCGGTGSTDSTAGGVSGNDISNNNTSGGSSAAPADVDFSQTDADMFTDRDLSGKYEDAVAVSLSSSYTITEEGTYIFSGTLADGSITVDVSDDNAKVQIVLNGVDIYCESGAPICVLNADKVFVTLAEGSTNTIATGETLEAVGEYQINAALYCRSDLTINGSGSLEVISPAGHGISCKDDLKVTGGSISVTCSGQGLDANDSIRICGGSITVDAGKDGIHAENTEDTSEGYVYISGGTMDIEAEGDGISASSYMQIANGTVNILAGGGYENGSSASSGGYGNMGGHGGPGGWGRSGTSYDSTTESQSMKGLKAAGGILISNGSFTIDSADDAIHSDDCVTINGGSFEIASGDDAVHAEDTLTITGCTMNVTEAYEGLEAEKIYVQGGEMTLNCSDDGLNASGGTDSSGTTGGRDGMFGGGGGMFGSNADAVIEISGGVLNIYSCGDCIDSNGSMTMSGGYVYATNPKSGDVSVLDSQNQPVITGGTYIGLGISTTMAETFSTSSSQGVIACTVGNQTAGTRITIADPDGNVVIDVTTEYSTVLLIISSPDIIKGESYDITAGQISGTIQAS